MGPNWADTIQSVVFQDVHDHNAVQKRRRRVQARRGVRRDDDRRKEGHLATLKRRRF